MLYLGVLRDHPDCVPAARAVATFAIDRDDMPGAHAHLAAALKYAPKDTALLLAHAQVLFRLDAIDEARTSLESIVTLDPSHHVAWLVLGEVREASGDGQGALRAWYQAITRAQAVGQWLGRDTTDPSIVDAVTRNIERLRRGRRDYLFNSLEGVRSTYGAAAVARVERALTGYLGEWDATPPDPRQRPKFFYFPGLPEGPYHDPMLHSWAHLLSDAWLDIRQEGLSLLQEDRDFESFLGLKPGQSREGYVGGSNPHAAWDAYFFYRHGRRHDAHHARCPKTSAILESIELCRVGQQAPEVCFSLLRPQSTIMPHYGVTNTRLVMHLPLIVPRDAGLDIVGADAHRWKEGELMMFDDTFQHGAWNRSDEPRLILLMDCWNPHLTPEEKLAGKVLIEAIEAFQR
jgi:aspartate beta-hydroxylase